MQHNSGAQSGHTVVFVDEDALPPARDWAFVEFDDTLYFVIKREHVTEDVLAEAWGTYLEMVPA